MIKRSKRDLKQIALLSQLPPEVITDQPRITIIGDFEIVIENHKGLIGYEDTLVKINTNVSPLLIEGNKLVIERMDNEIIVVRGEIRSLKYFPESDWEK
ncbi:sporulation protein YqfC [Caldicellulosiruptor owensensis OL]|uniref:Sporulation protein YqfC n=1 Tax=Caldicellulosiruptor owensensis (strain ATCC 700167 / DSM 13100 / OL) TaxID=632518 RepID=E4Q165_CALOW|nr:sporulation protein YqfC [Caldicellulosiruptor owensensis]ADQ04624.1 sporulation protein YqfC [Caldicellulosiruptor owensensis OL]